MEALTTVGALMPSLIYFNRDGRYNEPFKTTRYIKNSRQNIIRKPMELIQHRSVQEHCNTYESSHLGKINTSMIKAESGIYLIYCPLNDRTYVGKSKNMKRRFSEHERDLKRNRHKNAYLQNAYNLYTGTVFIAYPLELVEGKTRLSEQELYWANVYDVFKSGFNFAPINKGEKGRDEYCDANKGENNGSAKLTESQVIEICGHLNEARMSMAAIARKYDVSSNQIMLIRDGEKWGHLTKDYLNSQFFIDKKRQVKRLSTYELIDLCFKLNNQESVTELAKEFNITRQAIYLIRNGMKNKTIASKYLSHRITDEWKAA